MAERLYKCGYKHCLRPNEKIPLNECVAVGKRRYHKECANMRDKIEIIKRIYFDFIDDKSDYVQVVGVINNLIFEKKYDVDYVEFMMKYVAVFCNKVKSPYTLYLIVKNGIVEKKYNDDRLKKDVIDKFDNRCRKGSRS